MASQMPSLDILITTMMSGNYNAMITIPMRNGKAWCMMNSPKAIPSLMLVEAMPMLLTVATQMAMYMSTGDGEEIGMAISFYLLILIA